jgi:hypothetical protein
MLKASPTKETEMTLTTSDLFPKAEPILFPTLALSLKAQIEAFLEMETEALRAKLVDGNVNES